jgi:hypothetical protein
MADSTLARGGWGGFRSLRLTETASAFCIGEQITLLIDSIERDLL